MYKIAIIENLHEDGIELLKKNPKYQFELITDISEKNLIQKLPAFDACTLKISKLDEKILKHCTNLKVISRHGVGIDNVDLNYIKKKKIELLITASANAVAVAEQIITMFLTISKSVESYDTEVREGRFKTNANNIQTFELFNKNLLICGFGRIGRKLISRCLAFDTKVYVFDPFVEDKTIKQYGGIKIQSISEGLEIADYISLNMPLTKDTKDLINYSAFKKMKRNSIIVNTSRGGILNEIDLNRALNEKIIFGAALDVFSKEPIQNDNPLLKNKRVILSPHSATFTDECKSRMSIETIKNIIDYFDNKIDESMVVKL